MKQDTILIPNYWYEACASLSRKDKTMARLIRCYRESYLPPSEDAFVTLCRAIVGQQISVRAADAIWNNFSKLCNPVVPEKISRKQLRTLRKCGLSNSKALYLKQTAYFFVKNRIKPHYWESTDEEEIYRNLIAIKGIGRWTFEMFAIFYLRSPDIFPLGDLGLVRAIEKEYKYKKHLHRGEIEELANRWRPWRTVATWYLWRSIDPDTVVY